MLRSSNELTHRILFNIKGVMEPRTRILKSQDNQVFNKPIKALQEEFHVPKFGPPKDKKRT